MNFLFKFALKIRGSLNSPGDYNYIPKIDIGDKIPKVIHQTYHSKTIPPEILENVNHLKSMNPEWEVRIYDDEDIENYLNTNYPELIDLYKKINPLYGAAKADFFRYVLIYNEGGVYLDIKSGLSKPLDEILNSNDQYLLCHWPNNQPGEIDAKRGCHIDIPNPLGEFQQWHIVSVKGHPFLKAVIENVCNNIKNYNPFLHDTGSWGTYNLTGPIAYTLAITPILHKYSYRLARDHTNFGFIYSVFLSKKSDFSHHKLLKKHYSLLEDSLVILPFPKNKLFDIAKPATKLIKNILMKQR